jgi:hypothetical protein
MADNPMNLCWSFISFSFFQVFELSFEKLKVLRVINAKKTIHDPAKDSTDNRRDPEKPEL